MISPELLLPAGSLQSLRYAFSYGADAVYAGQPRYSLRARNNQFDAKNIALGIAQAHALGKKFFLTSNLLPHNAKVNTYIKDLAPIIAMQPDALIMADPGLIMIVREKWPQMPIHLSVQANTVNYASVKFWQQNGIARIILSRELSLDEIAEIRQQCPDIELEVFVHGALCIAYSGRCLLSGYFNHRDPNQGTCTNACRWSYQVQDAKEDVSGDITATKIEFDAFSALQQSDDFVGVDGVTRHPEAEKVYLIEEQNRKGELMPIMEDEHGTYIMNSRDLRAVEHVQKLVEIGIDCLKVEGRTKSHYYVARTAQVYRQAIDDALAGKAFNPELLADLNNLANRGYTDGFYQRHHSQAYQSYMENASSSKNQQFVGEIVHFDKEKNMAYIQVKNRFQIGDQLELITPEGNHLFTLHEMLDKEGKGISVAPGSAYKVYIPLPEKTDMGLLARDISTK